MYPSYVGRGIYNDHSTLTISNCTVDGNSDANGGGIYNDGYDGSASLTIYNCTVSDNSSDYGGGIYNDSRLSSNAVITICSSTVSNNKALDGNGCVGLLSTPEGITAAVWADRFISRTAHSVAIPAAFSGGGIFNVGEGRRIVTLAIENSTLCSNTATYYGWAVLNDGSVFGGARLTIGNTILSEGASGATITSIGDMVYNGAIVTSLGHNLSTDSGSGFLTSAPGDQINNRSCLLGPLADNGGPTKTHHQGRPARLSMLVILHSHLRRILTSAARAFHAF